MNLGTKILNNKEILDAVNKRRNFAIISHPDAGKTTLTEKLLLYGGAIQQAGAVKARGNQRKATSDWMELEKQRGISITSTVLQFEYERSVINLLDTPGHQDFSEDTYRTLAAADNAVMLEDAAKGLEPQTRKLFEVCKMRKIPIFTFINKMDRPGREPFSLLDEIESELGLNTLPINWPIGSGEEFRGVIDRFSREVILFDKAVRGKQSNEKRLSLDNDGLKTSSDLELYGSDFFNTFQTSFMPINEPNPDSTYTLDIGDILNIQLIGQQSYDEELFVNGDGSINLPDVGKIVIAGLSLKEASSLIKSKVKSSFIGTEAFISLARVRDVNILVTGNAKNPGIYTLTGNSNILHALSIAGGVSEFGSFREINLIRANNIIETLDVYDLLIDGKYNLNKRLRSGDIVFVTPRKNIISIDGAVKRPAKYEVSDNQFLSDVIRYANGIKQTADLENISLERILDFGF